MSLYQLTELSDVEVLTYFTNQWIGRCEIQEEDLYADDNKVDEETGKVYKFSIFDQECNIFRYCANTFLPRLKVGARTYKNNKIILFGENKYKGARPKLDGSHETLEERGLCPC